MADQEHLELSDNLMTVEFQNGGVNMVDWLDDGQKKKIIHNIRKKNGAIMITWQHGLENRGMNLELEWKI